MRDTYASERPRTQSTPAMDGLFFTPEREVTGKTPKAQAVAPAEGCYPPWLGNHAELLGKTP